MAWRTLSPDEIGNGVEGEAFVLAAGDEDDRLRRAEKRFFERIEVGRFRVVDVIDAVDFADEFEAMELRAIGAKRRDHLLEGQPAGAADSERGHHILSVMRAAQLRFGEVEDRLLLVRDPAIG